VQKLTKTLVLPAMLAICIAQQSWAAPPTGGSISGSVVDYNAAQVRDNNGLITVPTGKVTYTANTAIPAGTLIDVALPNGLQFTTPTMPSLSSSDETFSLINNWGSKVRFVVLTSDGAATSTIVLGSYTLKGANALEKVTPVLSALPLTWQTIGIDAQPLSLPEFASDSGIVAVFVGAIQFIDLSPPSNGSKFFSNPDTPTAVLSAIAISPQTVDFATETVPILNPDGQPNTLVSYDTATVEMPGALFGNITVFTSSTSDCGTQLTTGAVTSNALKFPNVPLNREIFFCAKATGSKIVELLGYPGSGYGGLGPGFTTVRLLPTHPYDDYLATANVNVEFPGLMCYSYSVSFGGACIDEYFDLLGPKS
jgi:hypothetical protein